MQEWEEDAVMSKEEGLEEIEGKSKGHYNAIHARA